MSLPKMNIDDYDEAVKEALAEMDRYNVSSRIWALDYTLWGDKPDDITNRLGWLNIPGVMFNHIDRLRALLNTAREDGFTDVLLLGMGGSSLAPEVFGKTFGEQSAGLNLAVLDSTDPAAVLAYDKQLDFSKTLFIVATKSGGTVETLSFFKYFYNRVTDKLGKSEVSKHFIAITDANSRLHVLAAQLGFRDIFLNDPNIGGRYSALSFFGLVPAALIGIDIDRLLDRALEMSSACGGHTPAEDNPGLSLGAVLGELAMAGRDKATLILSPPIKSFGDWVEQLIAESTGKSGKGILPVVGEKLGAPDVYGKDRLFIYLKLKDDDTYDQAFEVLEKAGHPTVRIELDDLYDLGGQFFLWEIATAVAGHLLGIHPFNQPNVEAAKVLARQMVAEYSENGELPTDEPAPFTAKALRSFLSQVEPGDYIALQAYVQPTEETDQALAELRLALRNMTKLAVTTGYGPRFLHSTGQLHKGDRGNGLFIQLTSDASRDIKIPDEAGSPESSISFGVLKMAQVLGDKRALQDNNRRVIRFHLGKDIPGHLKVLADRLI